MNLLVSDCYKGDMQGQTSFEWLEQVEEEDQQGEKNWLKKEYLCGEKTVKDTTLDRVV